jgi:hypothetical protein
VGTEPDPGTVQPWEVEDFQARFVEDVFSGTPECCLVRRDIINLLHQEEQLDTPPRVKICPGCERPIGR